MSSSSSESEGEDTQSQAQPRQKRPPINSVAGLRQKLKEIEQDLEWTERLDVTPDHNPPLTADLAVDDISQNDFAREKMFYDLTLACSKEALARLASLDYPINRPDDYFAQMAKSDEHMKKVRQKLLSKQSSIEKSEQAKKTRELRKFGKKVQHEVLQKRQKEKRDTLDAIKKYRKGQKDKLDFLEAENAAQGKGKKKMNKKDFKEKKFGFGGQKKRQKRPTAYSSADMSDMPRHVGKKPSGGGPVRTNKNKKKGGRPGKARRQNMKSRRK